MLQVIDIQASVPAEDPAVGCVLTPGPLSHGAGAPGKHCLRQSFMDKRAFVELQVCREEVPQHCGSKKYESGYIEMGRE